MAPVSKGFHYSIDYHVQGSSHFARHYFGNLG
jgi:hypothetical protein